MANVQHSALTDTDGIHEPKGISTASSNQVYVANGSSSGSWKNLSNIPGSGWGYYTNTTYTGTTYLNISSNTLIPFNLKSIETDLPVNFNGTDSTLMTLGTETLLFVSTGDLMAITLSFELVNISASQAYIDISLYGSSNGTTYSTLLAEKSVPILKNSNQFISETALLYVTANMASHGALIKASLPTGSGNIRDIGLISSRIHRAR
jgi:hypothetical protein